MTKGSWTWTSGISRTWLRWAGCEFNQKRCELKNFQKYWPNFSFVFGSYFLGAELWSKLESIFICKGTLLLRSRSPHSLSLSLSLSHGGEQGFRVPSLKNTGEGPMEERRNVPKHKRAYKFSFQFFFFFSAFWHFPDSLWCSEPIMNSFAFAWV